MQTKAARREPEPTLAHSTQAEDTAVPVSIGDWSHRQAGAVETTDETSPQHWTETAVAVPIEAEPTVALDSPQPHSHPQQELPLLLNLSLAAEDLALPPD
eukprot:m.57963 g.57963  ORF g.57963 m.57963 type:complete len:100 (-) comp49102_c0_seq1:195-494(-)